ncbi:MAG TPA: nickel pincer cofactor biosynthesis protein LarB [Pirellulales bacterium]
MALPKWQTAAVENNWGLGYDELMNAATKNSQLVEQLAQRLAAGELSLEAFLAALAQPKTADLGEVQLDLDRHRRCGYPEVVYGEGKSLAALTKIFQRMAGEGIDAFATRIPPDVAVEIHKQFSAAQYNAVARTLRIPCEANVKRSNDCQTDSISHRGMVAIVTAGTSDLPVAEEARETLRWMGFEPTMIHDVGVAGPHRLQERLPQLSQADVVIVVAGMEGALPSVVGGYVACPVIGVPTSVGYGASCGGLAALLSMLNSCAANVTVVNVDAGFKGGYVAGMIARRMAVRSA